MGFPHLFRPHGPIRPSRTSPLEPAAPPAAGGAPLGWPIRTGKSGVGARSR
jgi:hypothetical protein